MTKYKKIRLAKGVTRDEHRLVMERHIGRALLSSEVVHHKDGDTYNNDISNLKIMSRKSHVKLHLKGKPFTGNREQLREIGRRCLPLATLTIEQVKEIKSLLASGSQKKSIANHYGVHPATITKIDKGISWAWV